MIFSRDFRQILRRIQRIIRYVKGKGKDHPQNRPQRPEREYMYNSTLPLTSALAGGGWSTPRPGRLPTGMTPYPLYRKMDGPQGRSGGVGKFSPPTGIRSPDRPARSESLYRLNYPGPPYSVGIRRFICRDKTCVTTHLSISDVKNRWSYASISSHSLVEW